MVHNEKSVQFIVEPINPYLLNSTITIPSKYVDAVYEQALMALKDEAHTYGFPKGQTPISYIEQNYRSNIIDYLKEFLFKFFVIKTLHDKLNENKTLLAGQPRLQKIYVEPHQDAIFVFELSLFKPVDILKWKHLPFKPPARKNYKDIDRQVDTFIKDELHNMKEKNYEAIEIGDWINFDIRVLDDNGKVLLDDSYETLWLRIGDEEADIPFQEVFVDKKIGDTFCCNNKCLQGFFSSQINSRLNFNIEVKNIVKNSYFCMDHFKKHFRLKTNKDVHRKLIEVFSYRNDLSLRRSMAEEALKLLIAKHHLEAPNFLILRQQKIVLESVFINPDYQVYKTHTNFQDYVRRLAEKQAAESLMIDQIVLNDNVGIDHDDIAAYLNLLKRPRTKEFIYFKPPDSKIEGQEIPLNDSLLATCCRREKALNYVIYHLTKK